MLAKQNTSLFKAVMRETYDLSVKKEGSKEMNV